jgi:ABC-type uncharacterized transport system permease subunit
VKTLVHQRFPRGGGFSWWERLLLSLGVALHAALLVGTMFGSGDFRFGFAHALSMMALLALLFYGLESFIHPLEGMPALVLPPAALSVALPALFGGASMSANAQAPAFAAHVLIAMLAYAFIAIAAAHAVLMAVVEQRLHARGVHARDAAAPSGLPPLLTMERLLFQMLGTGFVFLTLTVVSGIVFSEEIFGRALTFDHKTVFGLLSWLIFGVLLLGRAAYGWRGRTALMGTFAGFGALLLAYVGSRFVLEVVLGRV